MSSPFKHSSYYLIPFFFFLVLTGCSKDHDIKPIFELPPTPVRASTVENHDVPLFFEAIGTVKPFKTADVKPQVTGMISKIHFIEGQHVQKGDLLYSIEQTSFAIKVQEMQALMEQDLSQLKNAQKKWERYQSLSNQDLIAKVEWDEMEAKVAHLLAVVKADEARLQAAKLDLKHCSIRAPLSGKISKSALSEGNMATGETLATISQVQPLYVDFSITDKELLLVEEKPSKVDIFVAGRDERLAEGAITFIDHTIDADTGMLSLRAVLKQADPLLRPGHSVRLHVYYGTKEKANLIPLKAIKTNQSGPYVFLVKEDNTVEMRSIKLGAEEKGLVVIDDGLDRSDRVVIEGHGNLFPGSKVEVLADESL
jgi:membrane fusion protein, multidrug efflux system